VLAEAPAEAQPGAGQWVGADAVGSAGSERRAGPDRRGAIALALVLLLTVVAYAPSLRGDFVYDDTLQIVDNPRIGTDAPLRVAFGTSVWEHIYESNNYRPLFYLWLIGQHRAFGLDEPATGYRVTLLALHLLAIALAYAVGRKLRLPPLVAAFGVALFALHPQRVSSAGWISGANDPLLAISGLGALWFLLRAHDATERGVTLRRRAAVVAAFFLALLCKEPAVTLLGVLVIADLFGPGVARLPLDERIRVAAVSALPLVAAVLVYLAMRFDALGYLAHHSSPNLSFGDALLTLPVMLAHYVGRVFWPVDLLLGPGLQPVTSVTDPRLGVGLLVAVGLFAATWFVARPVRCGDTGPARRVLLALSWLPLCILLDARNLSPDILVQDRYLYLPSVGFSLLAAAGVAHLCNRCKVPAKVRWGVAVALALVLAGLTAYEASAWKSNPELYRRAVLATPESAAAHYGQGVVFHEAGDYDNAIRSFIRAVELNPEFPGAWEGLGNARFRSRDWQGAALAYERLLDLVPPKSDSKFYLNGLLYLSRARLNAGDPEGALAPAKQLSEIRGPQDPRPARLLAEIERARGS
jgi:tetratricopeptide (TPR) repeat protein